MRAWHGSGKTVTNIRPFFHCGSLRSALERIFDQINEGLIARDFDNALAREFARYSLAKSRPLQDGRETLDKWNLMSVLQRNVEINKVCLTAIDIDDDARQIDVRDPGDDQDWWVAALKEIGHLNPREVDQLQELPEKSHEKAQLAGTFLIPRDVRLLRYANSIEDQQSPSFIIVDPAIAKGITSGSCWIAVLKENWNEDFTFDIRTAISNLATTVGAPIIVVEEHQTRRGANKTLKVPSPAMTAFERLAASL